MKGNGMDIKVTKDCLRLLWPVSIDKISPTAEYLYMNEHNLTVGAVPSSQPLSKVFGSSHVKLYIAPKV